MGEEFNTEQFIQNLWKRENLQGLKQVNGKGGYRNGRYFPYQGTNGIDIGPGFLLQSQSPAFQKKARTVGLTKKELDDSVRKSIKESMSVFNNRIKKEGGNPNAISNNVRMGLLDMGWQLGNDKFMNQYNNFWKAVANGDYEGMRQESKTTWTDKKGKHIDTSRWNFRKDNYFQDPKPLVPIIDNPTYIAQPDALRVAKPLVPPAVPSMVNIMPNVHADGGMLDNAQETPEQWDELSLTEKNAFIASAVKHGITNMEDIRNAYNELGQEQVNDDEASDENANKFLKGGYKPSKYIRNYIANKEGSSMKTNRSFEDEAKSFWGVLPDNVKNKLTQEQADALYSYSYNVGAGNFKNRVVPALQRYFSGNGSVTDVQKHMYATKDSQLRGLAKRRAEERAMFAGSKIPVYYDSPYADTPYTTNGSTWRSSRLGPVTSINMSRGLGVVANNAMNGNALLGSISNKGNMMKEAINALYDNSQPTVTEVPQERQSSLDRYNAIQDYLSSLSSFGYANGGKMNAKLGVVSSNGQYHVSPTEYSGVLNNVSNDKPLEVTLLDTMVTAADPRNYRSYYDPNGLMDFANIVTLGLPNRGSASQDLGLVRDAYDALRGKKTWKDVGLSAIMGNKGVFENPYANLALDFAVPIAGYGVAKLRTPKFTSELDWSPESWFSKRAGGKYDAEDVKALKSHVPEYLKIEKKAKANGTWLKMPDGSTWQGDPRSWVQMQSKNVKNNYGNEILSHGEDAYFGDMSFYTDADGNDIAGEAIGTKPLWTSTNPKVGETYGNDVFSLIIPKDTNVKTVADAKRRYFDNVVEGANVNTDQLVYPNLTENNAVRINNVVDPGDKTISIISKATDFLPDETVSDYIKRKYIGDDLVLGQNVRRKSIYGNNGNFDLGNVNIYKGLIPIGVGLSDYTLFHQFNK